MATGKWSFQLKKPEGTPNLKDPLGYNAPTDNVVFLVPTTKQF